MGVVMVQFLREGVIRGLIRRIRKIYPEGPTIYSDNDLARLQVIKNMANSMWKNYEKNRKVIQMGDYRPKETKNGLD